MIRFKPQRMLISYHMPCKEMDVRTSYVYETCRSTRIIPCARISTWKVLPITIWSRGLRYSSIEGLTCARLLGDLPVSTNNRCHAADSAMAPDIKWSFCFPVSPARLDSRFTFLFKLLQRCAVLRHPWGAFKHWTTCDRSSSGD